MQTHPKQVGKVLTVSNRLVAGLIGTASLCVDGAKILNINQTTAGLLALTLPNPTDLTDLVSIDVVNTGTASFTMYGVTLAPNTMATLVWTSAAWAPIAVSPAAVVMQYGEIEATSTGVNLPANGSPTSPVNFIPFTLPAAGTWKVEYQLRGSSANLGQNSNNGSRISGAIYPQGSTALVANSEVECVYLGQSGTGSIPSSFNIEATATGSVFITTTGPASFYLGAWDSSGAGSTLYSDASGRCKVVYTQIAGAAVVGLAPASSVTSSNANGNQGGNSWNNTGVFGNITTVGQSSNIRASLYAVLGYPLVSGTYDVGLSLDGGPPVTIWSAQFVNGTTPEPGCTVEGTALFTNVAPGLHNIYVWQINSISSGGGGSIGTTATQRLSRVTLEEVFQVSVPVAAVMAGATAGAAGALGLVPQPAAGTQDARLMGDATWDTTGRLPTVVVAGAGPSNTTLAPAASVDIAENLTFNVSTGGAVFNIPAPTVTGKRRRLRISNPNSVTTSFTINAGSIGFSLNPGFFTDLHWDPLGLLWSQSLTSTAVMMGATSATNGAAGTAPTPFSGQQDARLAGDGVWDATGRMSTIAFSNALANQALIASTSVDVAECLDFEQSTVGVTFAIPNPSVTSKRRKLRILASGGSTIGITGTGLQAPFVPSGQYLDLVWSPWSASWLMEWNPVVAGATASAAGIKGVVLAPPQGSQDGHLAGDATFDLTGRMTQVQQGNLATSTTLPATTTVDVCEFIEFAQTTAGVTATLPQPTVTAKARKLTVVNSATAALTIGGLANGTLTLPLWGAATLSWAPPGGSGTAGQWVIVGTTGGTTVVSTSQAAQVVGGSSNLTTSTNVVATSKTFTATGPNLMAIASAGCYPNVTERAVMYLSLEAGTGSGAVLVTGPSQLADIQAGTGFKNITTHLTATGLTVGAQYTLKLYAYETNQNGGVSINSPTLSMFNA